MTTKYIKFILTAFSAYLLFSCESSTVRYLRTVKSLSSFYKSNDVRVDVQNRIATVKVDFSKVLQQHLNTSEKEKAAEIHEQYSSLGALLTYTLSRSEDSNASQELDSIVINLKSISENTRYSYSYKSLAEIKHDSEQTSAFLKGLSEGNIDRSSSYLSNDIMKSIPKDSLSEVMKKNFPFGRIIDAKLVGFIVANGQYGIFENVFFENDVKRTYIFVFKENEDKIVGININ